MVVHYVPVFAEAVVLDMEQAVFDRPMAPYQGQGFRWSQGGPAGYRVLNTVHWRLAGAADLFFDHYHAGQAGEISVASQFSGYPDLPVFDASVPFAGYLPIRWRRRPGEEQGYVGVELGLVFLSLKV